MDEPFDAASGPPDYGASFADVYDDWYRHITDAEATADRVAALADEADNRRVLELGVGSGRLAIPIANRGLEIIGVDNSETMLERLRAKPGASAVEVVVGDMAECDQFIDGPFGVVLVAFNTLFNLADEDSQRRCLLAAASLLGERGSLVIEAASWGDPPPRIERGLSTSRVELDRVVLSATEHDPVTQIVIGQHIDITNGGVRLRPWRIRYVSPDQLDAMADSAGLTLVERHADWVATPFAADGSIHVSRYRAQA